MKYSGRVAVRVGTMWMPGFLNPASIDGRIIFLKRDFITDRFARSRFVVFTPQSIILPFNDSAFKKSFEPLGNVQIYAIFPKNFVNLTKFQVVFFYP